MCPYGFPKANLSWSDHSARQHDCQAVVVEKTTHFGFILTWSNTAAHSGLLGVRRDRAPGMCTFSHSVHFATNTTNCLFPKCKAKLCDVETVDLHRLQYYYYYYYCCCYYYEFNGKSCCCHVQHNSSNMDEQLYESGKGWLLSSCYYQYVH